MQEIFNSDTGSRTKCDIGLLHQNVVMHFKNKHIEQCQN